MEEANTIANRQVYIHIKDYIIEGKKVETLNTVSKNEYMNGISIE
jgi:hypothetical protein